MNQKDFSDEELGEEFDKAFKSHESQRVVLKIIRDEKESLDVKEKRVKKEFYF